MKKSEEFGRDYNVIVPPPPSDGNLYPIIEQHPNEITRGNNLPSLPLPPVYSQPSGNITGPPPYNEQQQQQFGCQNIGVRYFVHGQQEGGRCPDNNNPGREFHAIHTAIPSNGDTVFYYISSSSSNPNCKRSEPFLLIRRRRSSIVSIALVSLLVSILLIVFVRMHTDIARKQIKHQEEMKQQLYNINNYGEQSSSSNYYNSQPSHLEIFKNYLNNNNNLFSNSTDLLLTNSSSVLIKNNNLTTTTLNYYLINNSNSTDDYLNENISLKNETLMQQTQNEPPQEQQIE